MSHSRVTGVEDQAGIRSRAQSVQVGVRLTVLASLAGVLYAVATWSGQNRLLITILFAAGAAWALAATVVGPERIVRAARSEAIFLVWSIGHIAFIVALVAADGGAQSPLALLFFLPLAFAALSYPLPSVAVIGAVDVVSFAAVSMAVGHAHESRLAFFAVCLSITALLCAWEARDHDRQREVLAHVSRTDPLTGCLNRRGFEERLAAEIASSGRGGGELGLIVLDLDNFKQVNDTRGHAAGDELLVWTVERTREVLRAVDSLGRLGGDEFAVLLPGVGRAATEDVAARIRAAVGERVSVSAGVAGCPADAIDGETLHKRADAALYAAKRARATTTLADVERRFARTAKVSV